MTSEHPPAAPPAAVAAPRRVGELVGIQYLRGVAAMFVVVFHVGPQIARMGYGGGWPAGLAGGVDVFFVISGFIMWVTTHGREIGPLTFWKRRIVRIVPLYWIMTTVVVVVMLVAPRLLQNSTFRLDHVVRSYLFLPAVHPVKGTMEPVVTPGWTLNFEMFFYLIFGLALLLPARLRLAATLATLVLLILAGRVLHPAGGTVVRFYTTPIMLEFAMGVALGAVVTRGDLIERLPARLGWAMLAGGLVLVVVMPEALTGRVIARGVPAVIAVAGALIAEAHGGVRAHPWPKALGDASYSIYLTQFVTMSAAGQVWRRAHLDHLPGGLLLFGVVAVAASALVGWLCYRWLERPLQHAFRPRGRSGAVLREKGRTALPSGSST